MNNNISLETGSRIAKLLYCLCIYANQVINHWVLEQPTGDHSFTNCLGNHGQKTTTDNQIQTDHKLT